MPIIKTGVGNNDPIYPGIKIGQAKYLKQRGATIDPVFFSEKTVYSSVITVPAVNFKGLNSELANKGFQPSEDDLKIINQFTLRPHTSDEIKIYQMDAANTIPDRDNEQFPLETLQAFQEMAIGKAWADRHMWRKAPMGKIWRTDVQKIGNADFLILNVYTLNHDDDKYRQDLIRCTEAGIYFFVSIGFSIKFPRCNICDQHIWKCQHIPGWDYDYKGERVADGMGKTCLVILEEPLDFYEVSSKILLGAQYDAQMSKSLFFFEGGDVEDYQITTSDSKEEKYRNEVDQMEVKVINGGVIIDGKYREVENIKSLQDEVGVVKRQLSGFQELFKELGLENGITIDQTKKVKSQIDAGNRYIERLAENIVSKKVAMNEISEESKMTDLENWKKQSVEFLETEEKSVVNRWEKYTGVNDPILQTISTTQEKRAVEESCYLIGGKSNE